MPLYDYLCKQCGHRFEKIQKFSDPEEKVCPKCQGEIERPISAPAVQFKGSGWYATDYAKKSNGGSGSSGGSSSSGSSDSAKKSDSSSSESSSSKSESSTKKD